MIETIVSGIVVLGVLVFAHELGHFLAAKRSGIRVHQFSIGFWPKIIGIKRGETDYCISAIPLGGYVKMAGMSYEDEDLTGADYEFLSKPWHLRAFVALGGPAMNFVLALLLCSITGFVGYNVEDYPPVVGEIGAESNVGELGLRKGDTILAVDESTVSTWRGFVDQIFDANRAGDVQVRIKRQDKDLSLNLPVAGLRVMIKTTPPRNPPVIGSVLLGSPAYSAGIAEGDSLIAIDGKQIEDWNDLQAAVSSTKVSRAQTEATGSGASETEEEGAESAGLDEGPESGEIKFLTPEKYASPITSGLTLEVTPGMDPVTWDLTP